MNRFGVSRTCTLYPTKRRLSLVKMACRPSCTPNLGLMKSQRVPALFLCGPCTLSNCPWDYCLDVLSSLLTFIRHTALDAERVGTPQPRPMFCRSMDSGYVFCIMTSTWRYIWNPNIGLIKHLVLPLFETSPFHLEPFFFYSLSRTLFTSVPPNGHIRYASHRCGQALQKATQEREAHFRDIVYHGGESMLVGVCSYLGEPGKRDQTGSIVELQIITDSWCIFLKYFFNSFSFFIVVFVCFHCFESSVDNY